MNYELRWVWIFFISKRISGISYADTCRTMLLAVYFQKRQHLLREYSDGHWSFRKGPFLWGGGIITNGIYNQRGNGTWWEGDTGW